MGANDAKVTDGTTATSVQSTDVVYLVRGTSDMQSTLATLFGTGVPSIMRLSHQLFLGGTPQTFNNSGLITATESITHLTNDTTAALTISDGLYEGQLKLIVADTMGATSTLTGANIKGSSITFSAVGQTAILIWSNSAWYRL
jgi:hypothetical protein